MRIQQIVYLAVGNLLIEAKTNYDFLYTHHLKLPMSCEYFKKSRNPNH